MKINSIKFLEGSTCIYVRAEYSDDLITKNEDYNYFQFNSSVSEHGVIYSSSESNLDINTGTICNNYWDYDKYYHNIYYIDDLNPSTKYYICAYCKLSDGSIIYSDISSTYTNRITGNPSATNDTCGEQEGSPTGNNQCINFELALPSVDNMSSSNKELLISEFKKMYKFYRLAGFFLNFSAYYGYDTSCSTAACSPNEYHGNTYTPYGAILYNYSSYMTMKTIFHEYGHFLESTFREAQSGFTYPLYLSYGYLLGKKLDYMCQFLNNDTFSKTKCHSGHVDPYVSYIIPLATEDNEYSTQLLRCMVFYQATLGYDGFIGTMNKDLILPSYDLKEGTYYISSYKYGWYLYVENNELLVSSNKQDSDNYKWEVTYQPLTANYIIKNKSVNYYITTQGISSTSTEVQLCPTIYNNDIGDSYVIIKNASASSGWDRNAYLKSRERLSCTSSNIETITNNLWNPKSYVSNFIFEKID